jgi:NitT/TauT family transport system permease protein
MQNFGWAVLGIVSVVVVWVFVVTTGIVPTNTLPEPSHVAARIPDLLGDHQFLAALGNTMRSWLIALLVATVAGVLIGLVTSSVAWLRKPTEIVINTFRSIPSTALIPIAIVLWGLGVQMKVSVAVYAVIWPILINTAYGVAGTEPMRIDAARSMHWSWLRREFYVTLPSALPSIVTGIRIASGTTLVVIISTELLGAQHGVGTVLVLYQQAYRTDYVLAGTLIMGTLGALLYAGLVQIERRTIKWVPVG